MGRRMNATAKKAFGTLHLWMGLMVHGVGHFIVLVLAVILGWYP